MQMARSDFDGGFRCRKRTPRQTGSAAVSAMQALQICTGMALAAVKKGGESCSRGLQPVQQNRNKTRNPVSRCKPFKPSATTHY